MNHHDHKSFEQRRIAIFEPHECFVTNPSLVCLAESLGNCGALVDLLIPDSDCYPPSDCGVSRYPFPGQLSHEASSIRTTLRRWWERVRLIRVDRMFTAGGYDLIIGVDSAGIIKGYEYAKRFEVPLVYMSFEIFFHDELQSSSELMSKQLECSASQYADLVIIQDTDRARLLASENGLSLEKFEYLPVSPRGFPRVQVSDYLRRLYGLTEDQLIVLHAGSLAEWTYADELLDSVVAWPENFVLVVHTRYTPSHTDIYIQAMQEAKLPNLIVSTNPLPEYQFEQLVASADIGLVLYKTIPRSASCQKNIQTIGLSSGKFSMYMKYGLPVISVGQHSYAQLLEEYDFGEDLASFDEMPTALDRVRSNYAHHRAEAQRLFSEKLDFDIHWTRVASRLLEVLR